MASTAEFALQFALIEGRLTAYHLAGSPDAPAVLLLHGLGAAGSTYAAVVSRLSREYRVIVPDLLGSGRTAKPLVDYSPQEMASHVAGLLQELRVPALRAIVGHSQGAAVAVELCHQLPGRIRKLVLIDPPPPCGMRWLRPVTGLPLGGRTAEVFSALLPHKRIARLWLGFLYANRERLTDEVLAAYAATSGSRGYAAATARALRSLSRLDLHLESAPPTLLLWGAQDRLFRPSLAAAWQARLRSSVLTVLPATGHCPHEEQPAAVALALGEFLADPAPDRQRA